MAEQGIATCRVLLLIKGLGPGGAERLVVDQARLRDRTRFDVRIAYLRVDKEHLVSEAEAAHVVCTRLATRGPRDLRWVLRLRALMQEGGVDVVHTHSPALAPVARLVARTMWRRPRLVYTEHNEWSSYGRLTRWANRLTYRLDDAHVAVSDEVRASMSRSARRSTPTLVHGTDIDAVAEERERREFSRAALGMADDDVVVGTVANLRRIKAYPDLLRAARIVVEMRPQARFVAIGQGPLKASLDAEHARSGLGDRFVFLGYRADARRLMAAFDVFVLASRHEGLPIALMEARALGLPVVATNAGGLVAHVADGTDGLLVPAGSPDRLAMALVRLIDDRELRGRLAVASAAVAGVYDIRRAVSEVEDLWLNRRH